MALSPAVLRRVAVLLDQDTRVACCVASARLSEALQHPAVWRRTVVYAPTPQALQFVCRVRPEVLQLTGVEIRRAEWFMEQLLADDAHRAVLALGVSVAPVRRLASSSLLPAIAELPELRELSLEFASVDRPACLAFPEGSEGLRKLRYLRITECRGLPSAERRLEVYFGEARLPALLEVHLKVATSDVLAHVPSRSPLLRVVRYSAERESFEDAALGGARLDTLALDVRDTTAMHFLTVALESAARVERVQLSCFADVCFDAKVDAQHLTLWLHPPAARLDVAYSAVRRVASVSIEAERRCAVRFVGVGSWGNFLNWTRRTQLHIGMDGAVTVDPL